MVQLLKSFKLGCPFDNIARKHLYNNACKNVFLKKFSGSRGKNDP